MKSLLSIVLLFIFNGGCTGHRTGQFNLVEVFRVQSDYNGTEIGSCGPYEFIPQIQPTQSQVRTQHQSSGLFEVSVRVQETESKNRQLMIRELREVLTIDSANVRFGTDTTRYWLVPKRVEELENNYHPGLNLLFGSITVPDSISIVNLILPVKWEDRSKLPSACNTFSFNLMRETTYPNPFSPSPITISFSIGREDSVLITIYDLQGEMVCVLLNQILPAGYHEIEWDSCPESIKQLPNGVYFYKLETGDFVESKKMVLLR